MISPNDIINKVTTIQLILDEIEVRGVKNANALVIVNEQCNELKKQIKDAIKEIQNGSKTDQEAGEIDAESDTKSS